MQDTLYTSPVGPLKTRPIGPHGAPQALWTFLGARRGPETPGTQGHYIGHPREFQGCSWSVPFLYHSLIFSNIAIQSVNAPIAS